LGLRDWLKRRQQKKAWEEWLELERDRLDTAERNIVLKIARADLQLQKLQLKLLKREEQKKPDYIS